MEKGSRKVSFVWWWPSHFLRGSFIGISDRSFCIIVIIATCKYHRGELPPPWAHLCALVAGRPWPKLGCSASHPVRTSCCLCHNPEKKAGRNLVEYNQLWFQVKCWYSAMPMFSDSLNLSTHSSAVKPNSSIGQAKASMEVELVNQGCRNKMIWGGGCTCVYVTGTRSMRVNWGHFLHFCDLWFNWRGTCPRAPVPPPPLCFSTW